MADTFIVRTKTTDTGQSEGGAALAWDCPFAIVNESTTEVIEVREAYVEMAHGLDSTKGYLGYIDLVRISGLTGGRDEQEVKHSSASADVPAAVKIVRNPDSVVVGDLHRRFVPVGMLRQQFVSTFNYPRFGRQGYGKTPLSSVFDIFGTDEQGFILREGEGIALYCSQGALVDMRASCQFNIGTASYSVRLGFSPAGPGTATCAIFNGVGSGVVLDIRYLQVTEEVESSITYPPKVRVVIGPMQVIEAEELTPLAYDSSSAALAASVKCWKNGFLRLNQFRTEPWWQPQAIYEGAAGQLSSFKVAYAHQRMCARIIEYRGAAGATGGPLRPRRHTLDLVGKGAKGGIVLREGEGFAVAWGSNLGLFGAAPVVQEVFPTGMSNQDFVAVFTRRQADSALGVRARYLPGLV